MLDPQYGDPLGARTTWRWGYLESLWIANKHDRSPVFGKPEKPAIDPDELLAGILEHPSGRFLRELTVGIISFESNSYDDTMRVIGKRPRPTLKTLTLGDFVSEETELNWSQIGNCTPLYKGVPNLESLTLRSGGMKLGKIELPKLRELVIRTGGFDRGSLASICSAKWPHLWKLDLQLGREHAFKQKDLQPLLDGKAFPKVTHLGLGNAENADQICEWLAGSKIAQQLEVLDLSEGRMGDAGARAIAGARDRFPKLRMLDVSENWIGKAGQAALKGFCKMVTFGDKRRGQQDDGGDPENRYISGYE
jgi:Leucine Rich repeat